MNRIRSSFPSLITVFFMLCCLSGCQTAASAASGAGVNPSSIQGRYEGYLPCADCPGIEYKLELKGDGTYTASYFYTDRSERPVTESGRYTIDGTNVVLDKDDAGMKYFAVHPDGLQMLDIHQKPISGALSRNYLLTRVMPPTESSRQEEPLMEKKLAQGIDFYAFGNEPFWSVDIDFEKGMRFKSLTAAPKLNTPPAREDRAQDADVTRYYAQTEAGTLIVTVLGGECIDSMSGEQFPFRVRAEVKRSTDTEYTVFEGCGRYVEDNRLEDTWKLTAFGGRDLKAEDFGRGLPEIAFNLEENRVTGNSGCNRFAGRLQARGNRIIIRQTASTRMACPNMTFEDEFLSAITNHTLRYRINEDRLVLTNDQEVDITFKKTE